MPDASFPTGTVTFLVTDIEGSTALWEKEPQAMRTALAALVLHGALPKSIERGGSFEELNVAVDQAHEVVGPQGGSAARTRGAAMLPHEAYDFARGEVERALREQD